MLEVILQDPRGEGGVHRSPVWLDGADDLPAAYHFRCGKTGNLRRQYKINLQLRTGLKQFVCLKKHAGSADIFRCTVVPVLFTKAAVA